MLATYAFNDSNSIVYANYSGDDTPDSISTSHTRFYNNVSVYYSKGKWRVTLGIDFALQQNSGGIRADETVAMFSGLLAVRYKVSPAWNVYVRTEFLNDDDGFLTGVYVDRKNNRRGLKANGGTLGV